MRAWLRRWWGDILWIWGWGPATKVQSSQKTYQEWPCPSCGNYTIVQTGPSTGYCDACGNVLVRKQ